MRAKTMSEARFIGSPRFFDGIKCSNGHLAEKYATQGNCVVCQRDHARRWRQRNPFKTKAADAKKAWQKWNVGRKPEFDHITDEDIRASFKTAGKRCVRCMSKLTACDMTVDHVTPLSAGGTNSAENIQPMCLQCNMIKGSKIWNASLGSGLRSGFKEISQSIYFDREKTKWRVRLRRNGKHVHVGYFQTRDMAQSAADLAIEAIHT